MYQITWAASRSTLETLTWYASWGTALYMYASAVRLSPKGILIRRDSAQTAVRSRRLVDPTCPHSQDKFHIAYLR